MPPPQKRCERIKTQQATGKKKTTGRNRGDAKMLGERCWDLQDVAIDLQNYLEIRDRALEAQSGPPLNGSIITTTRTASVSLVTISRRRSCSGDIV